jgi:hypothetical protein
MMLLINTLKITLKFNREPPYWDENGSVRSGQTIYMFL